MQMRETARASIQSLPNQGARGGDYSKEFPDESHSFQKTSGLRYVTDNGSSEFDDNLIMQGRRFWITCKPNKCQQMLFND